MPNDAINPQPTLEEQIGSFRGFSSVDGVVQPENGKLAKQAQNDDDGAEEREERPLTAAQKLAQLANGGRRAPARQAAEEHADEDEDAGRDDESGEEDEDEAAGERQPRRDDRRNERRNSADKRIAQAVGRQRAAEREASALRTRLDALERRLDAGLTQQPPRANNNSNSGDESPPNSADYQYGELDPRYISDLSRYETLKTIREEDTRRAQAQQQHRENAGRAEMATKFREFESDGLARYDDFAEIVTEPANRGEWALSPLLASLILDSEHGPDIAYHLASDRKEAKRVFELTPAKQAAWFGQREAVLSAETPAAGNPALRVSRAPESPRRQARGSGSRQPASPDTTDFAAFERMANAKS